MNSFGEKFKITSFGESHGSALGVVIDGCPAGLKFDEVLLLKNLSRRKPGGGLVSARQESDFPEILSGVLDGKTLGTPIAMIVKNQDAKSEDYANLKPGQRNGHADDVWLQKFGLADLRGGGRASGRETVARVMAGSVAQMFLKEVFSDFSIEASAKKIGMIEVSETTKQKVEELLTTAKKEGKSYGGVAEVVIKGLPAGLGQPVFKKLKADLASAMMGIGATIGIQFGDGFQAADKEGSEFHTQSDKKHYGGIRGGISTGENIILQVAFKPTSSVLDVAKKGRHDPCIIPRALPVLESMACLVLADHVLLSCTDRVENLKRIFE